MTLATSTSYSSLSMGFGTFIAPSQEASSSARLAGRGEINDQQTRDLRVFTRPVIENEAGCHLGTRHMNG
jgi:hypothetical protein